MFYQELFIKLQNFRGTYYGEPLGLEEAKQFEEEGGVIIRDNINDEMTFLQRYVIEEDKESKIAHGALYYFQNLRNYIMTFTCEGEIPASFFSFGYIRIVYNFKDAKEKKEVVLEEVPKIIVPNDFLGITCFPTKINVPANFENCTKDIEAYLEFVNKNFTKDERIRYYKYWLQINCVDVALGSITYDNPYEFFHVYERQFGIYYEVVYRLRERFRDKLKLFILNDGVGAMSMIAHQLGVKYRSNEPFAVGFVAYKLGIITTQTIDFISTRAKDEVMIVCNLDNYLDLSKVVSTSYVIIDENRLTNAFDDRHIAYTAGMRVQSDLLDDNYVNRGRPISQALPMIRYFQNIPLTAKAEGFLIMNGLQVYSDGKVHTRTVNKLIDKNKKYRYITTSDKNKIKDVTASYLNIVSRNEIVSKNGKVGEYKYVNGVMVPFLPGKVVYHKKDAVKVVEFSAYKDPYVLRAWWRDGAFILSRERNGINKMFFYRQWG